ncbi:membrane protein insertase YidC [Neisseriaceae bacterium PsAf]|nr:membrane protein insertase YidC [Neisseriaceae bacterium PsAf]
MSPDNNKDYTKNSIIFLVLTLMLILGWNMLFPPEKKTVENNETPTAEVTDQNTPQNANVPVTSADSTFTNSKEITVTTDNYIAKIDEATGDIRYLELLKHQSNDDPNTNMVLLDETVHYSAQSRLIGADNNFFLENIPFTASADNYQLGGQDQVEVVLNKNADGIDIQKSLIFKKDNYVIDFKYTITNNQDNPLYLTAMYRLLHDGTPAGGRTFFTKFYTGPVVYTDEDKFKKISFESIDKGEAEFPKATDNGWLGIIQHYFTSTFLLKQKRMDTVCQVNNCQLIFNHRQSDNLYEVAFTTQLPTIQNNDTKALTVGLFSGPEEYKALKAAADNLPLVKDYGMSHIFANPLFIALQYIESFVHNWGWAIIILVILLKIILYPLNSASGKSMAKMRQVAPKMQAIKENSGDDKVKMQQQMMELYKTEKINPLGGCLPMLIQFPIFIGLYWALFNSVELRGAPWIGWITDLSKPDPYYILPILMAVTMFLQTKLNPPPSDPMQAKMMKIIPLVFSIMFFFFPSGLVLYWLVNNILTILQQWRINKSIENNSGMVNKSK